MRHVTGLAELIRIRILRGEIAAGDLLVEVLLAERLRTSRSSLREALRLLEGRGLLSANVDGGMRVVELDRGDLARTLELRATLEALSAAEAARRSRQEALPAGWERRMSGLLVAIEVAAEQERGDGAEFADRTWHLGMSALAGNRPCHATLDQLWDRILVTQLRAAAWRPQSAAELREHSDLIAAIAGGDSDDAGELARRHASAAMPRENAPAAGR